MLVWNQIENAVANYYISLVACNRHIINIPLPELNIIKAPYFSILSRLLDHRRSKVNTNNLSGFACFMSCDKGIVSSSTSEINHRITFFDFSKLSGQSAS